MVTAMIKSRLLIGFCFYKAMDFRDVLIPILVLVSIRYSAHELALVLGKSVSIPKTNTTQCSVRTALIAQTLLHKETAEAEHKMSMVWMYFKINDTNQSIADCKLYSAKTSRGGTKKFIQYKQLNETSEG